MSWLPLVAHDHVVEQMRRAVGRNRLGHAYLFVGIKGIGKRRAALHVAQGLLCQTNPPEALDPCGGCPGCVQVQNGAHPDLFTVARPDDKSALPVELIREMCESLSLKSAGGGYKVAVVDDADDFSDASANCFLKTLEEPPKRSVILLLASSVESQLTTIVSRCQVLRFRELTPQEVDGLLTQLVPDLDPQRSAELARWSGGSVGHALNLADESWTQMREVLLAGLAAERIDAAGLASSIQDFADSEKLAAARRQRLREIVRLAADFYRQALVEHHRPQGNETAANRVATRYPQEVLIDMLERCLQADVHLRRNLHQPLTVDCWLDDLSQIASGQYIPTVG